MANFFIERPIFAWVIALIVMFLGTLAITKLPVAQYPAVAPPTILIVANYPGADATTVQNTVTQVIEQNMNSINNLLYMSSNSDSSGNASITLTFNPGTDPDIAQVQVQNKLQRVMAALPQEVQKQGVIVEKSTGNFLMFLAFISENGSMKQEEIADYVASYLKDPLSRINGVGDVQLFGAQHAMRIWLDPYKLNDFKLTPLDVMNAIQAENNQVAAGELGSAPTIAGQQLNASIVAQTRLTSAKEFSQILLKANPDGSQVRLKDVADVELGAEGYKLNTLYNGNPATGVGIKLATGANALETSNALKAELIKLEPSFPDGFKVVHPYDTTPFIKISIQEVIKTLLEAIVLVFLVMYLFLQNFRATLIPTIAVPVVLLGTFGVLSVLGYSINTLTMFGMVLAIGLLVDDAIVVVENVERVMHEDGLSPKEASKKSMQQIQGALVGIALVLSSVFIPMAFLGGSTGEIYRQFSVTIVSAMVLSVLVALILTPALCATILKPIDKDKKNKVSAFLGWFNHIFEKSIHHYTYSVKHILKGTGRYLIIYLFIVIGMCVLFLRLPTSFLPEEDQGVFVTMVQLPVGASQERTDKVLSQVTDYFLTQEKDVIKSVLTLSGFGFNGQGQNMGLVFISLTDWSQRTGKKDTVSAVVARASRAFSQIRCHRIWL